ncbi:aminopeptidase Ey [Folsomia candida]|uniref:Aminopeptidase n=1 Tax=Folsomia candida TaxID=158441 RepID=A0A226E485_FOLCA|nr:aminopeptidase Ey [Folsomia candida]OXA52535.1 Aminopeptidase N [Folsomia candida]
MWSTREGFHSLIATTTLVVTIFLHTSHAIPPLFPQPPDFGGEVDLARAPTPADRLPKTLTPYHYWLELRPIIDDGTGTGERFTAPGKISIKTIRSLESGNGNTITFHSLNNAINETTVSVVDDTDGTSLTIDYFVISLSSHWFTIVMASNSTLVAGKNYTLSMEFVSKINTQDAIGLYTSVYKGADNSTKYLVSTDFQAPDARMAFPCFDEPHMKAVWEIDIIRQTHYHSLANMPLADSTPVPELPGWVRDRYLPTVPMSSYLICFAVSDFTMEAANTSIYSKPVHVWGPPPLMERGNGRFSPDFSAKLMSFFETYYRIEYALPKMDKISIPDYSSGAMENWGLNTYRDTRLLYEEGISTAQDMFSMTNTISHELVHQWWGNLVTCEWWSDLWIQEGAATYYAPIGVAGVGMGDLLPMETLITASIQRSFDFDANKGLTHPIHLENIDPTNVALLFDTLTYHKGASLIRMMNAIVSTNTYNTAMTRFLHRYSYSTATQGDMFAVLDEVIAETPASSPLPANVNLTQIMETWTLQSGYPVVSVERSQFSNNVTFTQERFFQRIADGVGDTTRWHIPLTVQRPTDVLIPVRPERWLTADRAQTSLIPVSGAWIIVNPQSHGYYRVHYKNALLDAIIDQLWRDHTVFDVQVRSTLVDDNINLGYAGYLDLGKALNLTLYLRNERVLFPWQSFFTNMALPYRMYARSSPFSSFKKYVLDLTADALTAINIQPQPSDDNPTTLLRTLLVTWRCNLGDAACITYSIGRFSAWMNNPSNTSIVAPDLQPSVYCTAIANGGDSEWNFVWSQYLMADRDVIQTSLIRALACSKTSFRLNTLLEMAFDLNSGVRGKHRTLTVQAVAGNSAGVNLAFSFLRANWEAMIRRYGASMPSGIITTLSTQLISALERKNLEDFVASTGAQLQLSAGAVENLDKGAHWRTTIEGNFTTFIRSLTP